MAREETASSQSQPQPLPYSLQKTIALWFIATLPMVLLAWLAVPILIPHLNLPSAIGYWLILLPGMVWQCALALWLIRHEAGNLRWGTIYKQIGLTAPRHPRTGEQRFRLSWRALPRFLLMMLILLLEGLSGLSLMLTILRVWPSDILFQLARGLRGYTQLTDLVDPRLAGRWDMLVLVMVGWIFCALPSEELFYRGILLPRMGNRLAWLGNAILYSLSYLYRPWAIPFRFVEAILIARPTQRLRSMWLAIIIRSAEGVMILTLLLVAIAAPALAPIPADVQFPNITLHPDPADYFSARGTLDAIPHYQGNGYPFSVDLRHYDISHLDLRSAMADLEYADFDTETTWPPAAQLPSDFDPAVIAETSKNPGLGVRALHERGITGQHVGIAIIDQPLLTEHQEYAERLMWYEDLFPLGSPMAAQMHGPAVSSIALGKTVGVAPEADLYYFSVGSSQNFHYHARAVRRALEINQHLPSDRQIRVMSLSTGWMPQYVGYDDMVSAVTEAEDAGVLVLNVDSGGLAGLARHLNADPDDFTSYEPGIFWADSYYGGNWFIKDMLLVPMDSRTVAGPGSAAEYEFGRIGGMSWAVPYLAGVYALSAQVDPAITPNRFWTLAHDTGRTIEVEHDGKIFSLGKIVDPAALIAALE
ncbi:MAG: CPBP family intramembrane metalloprotease [Anaerolineae bacterium]|nr:CPBP family intramembrane metalloprotease [Anaerolineae bacterium]